MSVDGCGTEVWGCARCAQITRTCCQTRQVFVTVGDRRRIAEHTGQGPGDLDFWSNEPVDDPAYLQQDDDPNWVRWVFQPDGTRPVLRHQANGDCTFLTPTGCSLPADVRPLICRLYPLDYTEHGITGVCEGCPPEVVPPGGTLLRILEMRLDDARRWHRMLYTELRTGRSYDESGTDLRLER